MRLCTTVSLAIYNPTITVVPRVIINGYKNVLVVAIELDCYFPLAEKVEYMKDPIQFKIVACSIYLFLLCSLGINLCATNNFFLSIGSNEKLAFIFWMISVLYAPDYLLFF